LLSRSSLCSLSFSLSLSISLLAFLSFSRFLHCFSVRLSL
jgi:hypothetical protein